MKKAEFYNDIKTNIEFLTGLPREDWYNAGGSIILENGYYKIVVKCNRNVVTLFTSWLDEKNENVTDYNKGYKDNMVTLTAEKIDKFLTI